MRVLNENVRRYEQILRIEPGVAEYDWLVQRYLESQTTENVAGNKITDTEGGTEYGGQVVRANSGVDVETLQHGHAILENHNIATEDSYEITNNSGKTGDETTQYGKGVTSQKTGYDATDYGKTDTLAKTGTQAIDYGKVDTRTKTGTVTNEYGHEIEETTDNEQSTLGARVKETTDTRRVHEDNTTSRDGGNIVSDTYGFSVTDQKSLTKQNPMSVSYANGVAEPTVDFSAYDDGGVGSEGGALDWTAPSAQGAAFGKDSTHTKTVEDWGNTEVHNDKVSYVDNGGVLRERDSFDQYKERLDGSHDVTHSGEDVVRHNTTDRDTNSGSDTTRYNVSDARTFGGTDQNRYNVTNTDSQTGSDKVVYDTRESGVERKSSSWHNIGTGGETHQGTDTTRRTLGTQITETDGRTVANTGTTTQENSEDRTRRTRHTGRYNDPAQLLERAARFIMSTDAWEFLYPRLDVCFMAIYD